MWQDFVFTAGSLIFAVALWPSVRSIHKPALASSIMTATVLFLFAITYTTLGLTFSAITTMVTASMWTTLAIQKYRTPVIHKDLGSGYG